MAQARFRDSILGYGAAAFLVFAIIALRFSLKNILGADTPLIVIYLIPVAVVSWNWGLPPAVLALLLSGLFGDVTLHDPAIPTVAKIIRMSVWMIVGTILATLVRSRQEVACRNAAALKSAAELAELGSGSDTSQRWLRWGWTLNAVGIVLLFASCETIKELSHPELTKWESHIMSIAAVSIIATVILYRSRLMIQRQVDTNGEIAKRLNLKETELRKLVAVACEMTQAVIIINTEGRTEWINASCERITGYSLDELRDRCPADLLTGEQTDRSMFDFARSKMREGERFSFELQISARGGQSIWVSLQLNPIHDRNKRLTHYVLIGENITEKREMWDRLRASEERARLIIDTAMDAVVLVDVRGLVAGWNPQAEAIFGYEARKAMHRPFLPLVIDSHDRPTLLQMIEQARHRNSNAGHTRQRAEITAIRCDGSPFPAEVSIAALGEHHSSAWSFFIRDISEARRSRLELCEAKERAESANKAKSDFLAMMSHEIRTPLNGIVGMIDLLHSADLAPAQRRYADVAKASATTLLRVINDILDFSKIEAGRLELEVAPFHLHGLLEEAAAISAATAAQKGLSLFCQIDPRLPRHFRGDAGRLKQILLNLLSNAIKFTDAGQIRLHAEPAPDSPESQNSMTIKCAVTDTGIGIPEDRRHRLFASFSQVDASTTRKYGGTGLGLAICKRIAELMGGTIGVESQVGAGSTFWFTIRLEPASAQDDPPRHQLPPAPAIPTTDKPVRVLLAEDNEINQLVALEVLKNARLECDVIDNGQSAVERALARSCDIILMDCQMPVLDGIAAARQIRAAEKARGLKPIPIVALTANAINGDRELCLAAGMNAYISKPLNSAELICTIHSLLPTSTLPPSAPPLPRKQIRLPNHPAAIN